ncbi:solute carrier family 15 member 4 [Patella vulgata]|uniref:solute carrier family 15 member 4 n=1 Tax=Patella vulgata TaxID=6465 RepID=UPI0024A7AD1F|nr:solute carrier family 15 member 4 [Patella vulgata]
MDEQTQLIHRSPSRETNTSPVHRQRNHEHLSYWKMQVACGMILFTVILERLAFYSLSGNLVLFLNKNPFNWMSYHALSASFYFLGVSFVTSLFGGWLADSFLGRYKAILVAFIIYIAGYGTMPFLALDKNGTMIINGTHICKFKNQSGQNDDTSDTNNPFNENCVGLVYIVLTVIAIGTGSVKANIAPFGADQVLGGGQQPTLVFFNWFYWCINIGAFLGLGIFTYIEQQKSFYLGYLISGSALAFGAVLFLFGGCVFIRKPASGSVFTNIFKILREACRSKRRRSKMISRTQRYIVDEADNEEEIKFLDHAKHRHGGIYHDSIVDDVRDLKKIICVFIVLIPYWVVYFQMQTTFLLQGLHMRLLFKDSEKNASNSCKNDAVQIETVAQKSQIAPAWLSLFDVIMLIIMLPLFDRVIYPRLAKAGYPFSMTKRILVGMVFAIAAMLVAGALEHFRLKSFWPYDDDVKCQCKNRSVPQIIGDTEYYAADLSVLWQIPQYALIGMSEVFTSVAGLQFAVSMAPKSMKGIIMGLFYFTSGIGSFLGTAITGILNANKIWFVDGDDHGDINCRLPCRPHDYTFQANKSCHLDYYFYFLAGVELIGLILFVIVSKIYHLDQDEHNQNILQLPVGEDKESPPGRRPPHSIQRSISNM